MYLCIDPGNTGTGFAVFDLNWKLLWVKNSAHKNFKDYGNDLKDICSVWRVSKAFIENPCFQSAGKGIVAAKSGSLVKLSKICGVYEYQLQQLDIEYQLIEIVSWKGQVPGDIMFTRILKNLFKLQPELEENPPKSHALDAVGIGLWVSKQPVQ